MRRERMIKTLGLFLLLTSACQPGQEQADRFAEHVGQSEYAYKHGPPPGNSPYAYLLTSYGGNGDVSGTPACGGRSVDGQWYYATGAYTFGCQSKLMLQAQGKCVVVNVVDNGPASWVEQSAQKKCGGLGYIIDASPLVSKYLFKTSSAGWVDCFAIQVTPVAASTLAGPTSCPSPQPEDSGLHLEAAPLQRGDSGAVGSPVPQGEVGVDARTPADRFIGEKCSSAAHCSSGLCLTESEDQFPEGLCTESCDTLCPDSPGHPSTFCVALGGQGRCVSRCDNTISASGCRQGYRCQKVARHLQSSVKRNVCLPENGKPDSPAETPDLEGDQPNPELASEGLSCALAPYLPHPGVADFTWICGLLLFGTLRRRASRKWFFEGRRLRRQRTRR
jgi:hypothetical protein